jgi:hypothetical protein
MQRFLLTTASVIALVTGASSAMAFDHVHWDWDLDAKTDIDVDVDVDIKIDPSGATIVEVDQDFKGDLNADAHVIGVINDPKGGDNHHPTTYGFFPPGPPPAPAKLDAVTELPSVENVAAAIGNATSVESEVSVQADIEQSVKDNDWDWSGAQFTADASVVGVVNASVDNAAQAIGNSVSLTLDPAVVEDGISGEADGSNPGFGFPCWRNCGPNPHPEQGDGIDTNAFLMANIDQYANFDGSANAFVGGVYVAGYKNLGLDDAAIARPLVSNSAVAVGNTVSITVQTGSLLDQ